MGPTRCCHWRLSLGHLRGACRGNSPVTTPPSSSCSHPTARSGMSLPDHAQPQRASVPNLQHRCPEITSTVQSPPARCFSTGARWHQVESTASSINHPRASRSPRRLHKPAPILIAACFGAGGGCPPRRYPRLAFRIRRRRMRPRGTLDSRRHRHAARRTGSARLAPATQTTPPCTCRLCVLAGDAGPRARRPRRHTNTGAATFKLPCLAAAGIALAREGGCGSQSCGIYYLGAGPAVRRDTSCPEAWSALLNPVEASNGKDSTRRSAAAANCTPGCSARRPASHANGARARA